MEKIDVGNQDAQQIAELALSLRNLSFLIGRIAEDDNIVDPQKLKSSLFSLHCLVDGLSNRLGDLNSRCRVCVDGNMVSSHRNLPCADFMSDLRRGATAGLQRRAAAK